MSTTYSKVKDVILSTPACPDGSGRLACASCLAEAIAALIDEEGD